MNVLRVSWLDVGDLAPAIVYLASEESRYVTGTITVIDAGVVLPFKIPQMAGAANRSPRRLLHGGGAVRTTRVTSEWSISPDRSDHLTEDARPSDGQPRRVARGLAVDQVPGSRRGPHDFHRRRSSRRWNGQISDCDCIFAGGGRR
jgi:hypothetical protein